MMRILSLAFMVCITGILACDAEAKVDVIGESSEWEATGFNNGRRVVRDCTYKKEGHYHYVWHSQKDPNKPPCGRDCDIYYACANENGQVIIGPVNLTHKLKCADNRYPSIAIENKAIDEKGAWRKINNIHLVWQCRTKKEYRYDIFHAVIKVNPPRSPDPFANADVDNLTKTFKRDSLVPAVAINHYDGDPKTNQSIHVVWQEECVYGPNTASDIFYTRSQDSGLTFSGPQTGGPYDNLTQTRRDSQMPSISCSLDTFQGFPLNYKGADCSYASKDVHVSYNEKTQQNGINIYYLRSPDFGYTWLLPQNVTVLTGGTLSTYDAYPSIAADMKDFVHIVWMREVKDHSPDTNYNPGFDPGLDRSFPGPYPGMYGTLKNHIVYWSNIPNRPPPLEGHSSMKDKEFPTVALDREQHVTVDWQEWRVKDPEYDIYRALNKNLVAPTRPITTAVYSLWSPYYDGLSLPLRDDLFPNLAHKKVSMYTDRGITELWSVMPGTGPGAATSPIAKMIVAFNNLKRDPNVN